MQLYNSLSRTIASLDSSQEPLSVYACGITPYDTTHLGHAFTYTTVDLLVRYLEHRGQQVRYVQNVTDIDDDILRTAAKAGEDWRALGDRWTVHFIQDMLSLNVRPPDDFPRATDVIPEIREAVQSLLDAGVAYAAGGSVYYDLRAWPYYGRLCGLNREQMLPIANERGNRPEDPNKRDPLDFVLWQAQVEGEPAWDSPWGPGRPGWHIECSTMAGKFLGETVDVHAGGGDLIFPHHESEIAQAEPLTGSAFVRFWMHVAMVEHEGQKMSKSLGNLVMVRDLLAFCSADALRLYLASHHYRSPWSHSEGELQAAQGRVDRLEAALEAVRGPASGADGAEPKGAALRIAGRGSARAAGKTGGVEPLAAGAPQDPHIVDLADSARLAFAGAMDDDLNSPAALQVMDGLALAILEAADRGAPVDPARDALRELAGVIGLRLGRRKPEPRVTSGWGRHLKRFAAEERAG